MSRQPTRNADKRQTVTSAFLDTWNDARLRRAARQERYESKRAQRKKPPPWIVRKLAVFFVVGILSWAQYVYVGRLCVPLIRKESPVEGNVSQAIAYLIVFEILWLMSAWCYLKIALVSPGFARDYVKKSPPPQEPGEYRPDSMESITNYTSPGPTTSHTDASPPPASTKPSPSSKPKSPPPSSYRSMQSKHGPTEIPESNPRARSFGNPAEVEAFPPAAKPHAAVSESPRRPEPAVRPSWDAPPPGAVVGAGGQGGWMDPPPPSRSPNSPVLTAAKRYCYKDELVKPYRSHHCSTCATDVLAFDHHCIWVGQCVGARNRKFFVNFLQWGTLLSVWLFVTLIISLSDWVPSVSLDGEEIAILALSGFFLLFISILLFSHTWLLTINATTVEHLAMQRMHQLDMEALNERFAWWNFTAKGRQLRQWNYEWGHPHTEGNIWWLGSRRACWEATMGRNPLWWFLPIGHSESDGLTYPVNPRFAPDGRWRRRSEWPAGLR